MEKFAKLANWNYGAAPQFPYGDETSYGKAIEFLDGPYIIEDWGCGVAWARKFVKRGRYFGIDGNWSLHCDLVADLRTYHSLADAILLRHVLEHNYDWRKILANALLSFQKKFVLILFTPFSEVTGLIQMSKVGGGTEEVPDLSFRKQDLTDMIGPLPYTEESLQTATQYGVEHIFYISRKL